jgi:hypothetical protein
MRRSNASPSLKTNKSRLSAATVGSTFRLRRADSSAFSSGARRQPPEALGQRCQSVANVGEPPHRLVGDGPVVVRDIRAEGLLEYLADDVAILGLEHLRRVGE